MMNDRIRQRALLVSVAVLSAGLLTACETTERGRRNLLDFMADGTTSCADMAAHLGTPSATLDHGNILTFRIAEDSHGYKISPGFAAGWDMTRYSLVAVCDSAGVLERHALVPIKAAMSKDAHAQRPGAAAHMPPDKQDATPSQRGEKVP